MLRCVTPTGESQHNTLATVADNVDRLLKQMTSVISQRQSLYYEKQKCLKLVPYTLVNFLSTRQLDFRNKLFTCTPRLEKVGHFYYARLHRAEALNDDARLTSA